jgi:hypothetical protein
MSTAIIRATQQVRVVKQSDLSGSEGFVAPPDDVIEVLGYRTMRLTLRIIGLEASGAPQVGVWMETGMERDTSLKDRASFARLGIFDLIGEGPTSVQRVFTDLQRYVRWRVFILEGGDATVQFTIEGVVYE